MYKFGLKLWSVNENYIDTAKKLYDENIYDYIELYAIPSSFDEYAELRSEEHTSELQSQR